MPDKIITTPSPFQQVGEQQVFRRHRMTSANGRAVRPGVDNKCVTGYHQLWHGYDLAGETSQHDTDVAAAPLDAPDYIPGGGCRAEFSGGESNLTRHCSQMVVRRG